MYRALLIALAGTSLLSFPAYGWGKTGHRVTGEIAETYLSEQTQVRIQEILGVEDLAEASTWPDFMRSNPADYWQRTANPWHYVTVPEGETYPDVDIPEWGDAATALAAFRETLRSEIWQDGETVSFRTSVVERDLVVLNNGFARISAG